MDQKLDPHIIPSPTATRCRAFFTPKTRRTHVEVKPNNDMIRPLNPEHAANLMADMTVWENAEIAREEADNGDK